MDGYRSLTSRAYTSDTGASRRRVQLPNDFMKDYESKPSTMYHSTPKTNPKLSSSASTNMNSTGLRASQLVGQTSTLSPSHGRASPTLQSRSLSPVSNARSITSPSKLTAFSTSPTRLLSDVDTDTVQKQRRELQLLIGELKDRDRELNDMVQAHQKQLAAWEEDRQRVLHLEKKCARLQSDLKSKSEQIKTYHAKVKAAKSEEANRSKELETTQIQLHQVSEQANLSSQQAQDLEERNQVLTESLKELSTTIGQLQAREQELITKLRLKDNDIVQANLQLGEFQQKVRKLELLMEEVRKTESSLKNERDQYRDQCGTQKQDIEKLRNDISKQFSDADEQQAELAKGKQEILVLQKELFLAGEREKRKDQLLELQKSKQERSDSEMQNLRQLVDRQQRDIAYMQVQLQVKQETDSVTTSDVRFADLDTPRDIDSDTKDMSFEDKFVYNNNNGEIDQDNMSTTSLEFEDNKGDYSGGHPTALSMLSTHATAGSDLLEDIEGMTSDLVNFTYSENTSGQVYSPRTPPQPDDYNTSATEDPLSPTSKLHRLLAESRQMVQNLENSTPFRTGQQDATGVSATQFTPPTRHQGSPQRPLPGANDTSTG